ncbi:hypothetical protein ACFPIJ_27365 [Dactylosporangium cerinum]|uniref:Transposase n=1 Tax=Dactylosporangium cerinum TaxID=1434730 RepID=A0ABV9VZ16_9ACTN
MTGGGDGEQAGACGVAGTAITRAQTRPAAGPARVASVANGRDASASTDSFTLLEERADAPAVTTVRGRVPWIAVVVDDCGKKAAELSTLSSDE